MRFTAVITKEGKWYIAHCVELGVVSQGRTIEEAQANLKEAVELYIESFGREDLPYIPLRLLWASKLPVLSGEELIKALLKAGFTIVHQRGSQVSED